jgi:hypothetical protein
MYRFLIFALILTACSSKNESKHPFANFFYPYDEEPKFYIYRDVAQGLDEKFNRVYGIEDSYGKHIVVENYAMDGRLTEAYNYNLDSLNLIDHMVVGRDGQKNKAILIKDGMYPFNDKEQTWFASKFPGVADSTVFLSEIKRSFKNAVPFKSEVMGKSYNTISFKDLIRLTVLNPFTKQENEMQGVYISHFAEKIGLVRIHDEKLSTDFRLEKIISEKEFVKIIRK